MYLGVSTYLVFIVWIYIVEGCRTDLLVGDIIGCYGDDREISDINTGLVKGTECIVETRGKIDRCICGQEKWICVEDIAGDSTQRLPRRKRGFFRRIGRFFRRAVRAIGNFISGAVECVVTLFQSCWDRPKPDKTPPIFRECPQIQPVTADPFQINERVFWNEPTAHDDRDGEIRPRRYGKGPGKHFPEHTTKIVYEAKDRNSNTATCIVYAIVEVIRCPDPEPISNGYYYCHPSTEFVLGGWCKYGCYEGFELKGESALTCLNTKHWSQATPTCKPIQCPDLPLIEDAGEPQCTDGTNFRSICSYNCKDGYDMPVGVSKTVVCSKNKIWKKHGEPMCMDVEPPAFTFCPGTVLAGTDIGSNTSVVSWDEPIADDNSEEHVRITLKEGFEMESRLPAGKYNIVYDASDAAGNFGTDCSFSVVVRDVKCSKLYATPYVRISCPFGYRTGSLCNFTCAPGKTMIGSEFVRCEKSTKGLYGTWNWRDNKQTVCAATTNCEALVPPRNGAIACDNWMGGEFCQAQCRNGTNMSSVSLGKLYVCTKPGDWAPVPKLRHCTAVRIPRQYLRMNVFYYYSGDCTDPDTQKQIADNFIHELQTSILYSSVCNATDCKSENVQVYCGEVDQRKRSVDEYMQLDIELRALFGNNGNTPESSLTLISLVKDIANNNMDAIFGNMSVTLLEFNSGIETICLEGSVPSEQSFNCVPCPEGTFYSAAIENGNQPTCELCNKGSYQNELGQMECISCGNGFTTRSFGAVSFDDCEYACFPGTYSNDGLFPCTPCGLGTYASTYAQTECAPCPGDMSTSAYGSTSVTECKEYDIVFPLNFGGAANLVLSDTHVDVKDFTVIFWYRNVHGNITTPLPSLAIAFTDADDNEVWSINDIAHVSLHQTWTSSFSVANVDSRWHKVVVYSDSCMPSMTLDGTDVPIETVSTPDTCIGINISGVHLTSGGEASVVISQLKALRGSTYNGQEQKCFSDVVGDIIKWQYFGDSELSGSFIDIPSECDDYDNCNSSPCMHGICQDALDGYSCTCEKGYTGVQCEQNIDDCLVHVCMNDASCIDEVANYSCLCPPLFTGAFCQIDMVHGQWSSWGNWSECSQTCGTGSHRRKRLCNNPTPSNGGDTCEGDGFEVSTCEAGTPCPVCGELLAPANGSVNCNHDSESWNCTIHCDDGFDFDIQPLDEYRCGPDTFHVWNFETGFNPEKRLPRCVGIREPKELSVRYSAKYKDLYCANEAMREIAFNAIGDISRSHIDGLSCVQDKTCQIKSMATTDCDEQPQRRRKREQNTAGFSVTLSITQTNSEDNITVTDFEAAIQTIQDLVADGQFSVDILDDIYEIDLNQTDITGDVTCGPGETRVYYYCIPCGQGSYLNGELCQMCEKDTYQDVEGQSTCKPCPEGQTTVGGGATSTTDCKGNPVTEDVETALKATGIIVGCILALAVVATLIALLVYRRYRASRAKRVEPTDISRSRTALEYIDTTIGPAKMKFQLSHMHPEVDM